MQVDPKKVQAWLKAKGVKASCPACGKKSWSISDVVAGPVAPGQTFPMIPQICGHCAFVRFLAGVPAGLV